MSVNKFRAWLVDNKPGDYRVELRELSLDDLPPGEVLVKVAYSGVNYKDGLALQPDNKIIRQYPMVPGVDLSGTVVDSSDSRFKAGDQVIGTNYGLGLTHYGGFSEYARVPAGWLFPLPAGMTLKEAMAFGSAGFTALLALHRLESNGLEPEHGPVLITGATGGVGSFAVTMLAQRGYHVVASTGKKTEHEFLESLGASEVLDRSEVGAFSSKTLEKERWAASIDSVGGATLSYLLRTTRYGGSVASIGLTGGADFQTTVYPFILRGVSLLGINVDGISMKLRQQLWERLAGEVKAHQFLESIGHEATLEEIPALARAIVGGKIRGRVIIRLAPE